MTVLARVVNDPISPEAVTAALAAPESGANVLFWGLVRDHHDGRRVCAVSYDVHAALAERTFGEIGEEACARWGPGLRVVVIHRAGRLEVGAASVVIGVSSPHRDEAYQASRHVIEELKRRAPVWKQEHYVDGDSAWLPGHSLRANGGGA